MLHHMTVSRTLQCLQKSNSEKVSSRLYVLICHVHRLDRLILDLICIEEPHLAITQASTGVHCMQILQNVIKCADCALRLQCLLQQ